MQQILKMIHLITSGVSRADPELAQPPTMVRSETLKGKGLPCSIYWKNRLGMDETDTDTDICLCLI